MPTPAQAVCGMVTGPVLQFYNTKDELRDRRLLPHVMWTIAQCAGTVGCLLSNWVFVHQNSFMVSIQIDVCTYRSSRSKSAYFHHISYFMHLPPCDDRSVTKVRKE